MTPESYRLLQALAPGQPLSGQCFAADHGISRAAVWKQISQLRRAGLPISARSGQGYQLAWPMDLLDPAALRKSAGGRGIGMEFYPIVESTSGLLNKRFGHRCAVVAEYQACGRGRRGRSWLSPPACGITLSYGFEFQCGLPQLGPLSLVAGIAAADTLRDAGAPVRLKWPNDLTVDDRKLGGLLVEIRGASDGPCQVVIGLGINVRLPRAGEVDADYPMPDQAWIDLAEAAPGRCDRTGLTSRLIDALDQACTTFDRDGFAAFRARWQALDGLIDRDVRAIGGDGSVRLGRARGVSDHGALRLECEESLIELTAAEVSIRVR
ncbi:MAG: biotin--[acetyl-CoA-carboxylase] ligase [Wenzhouxiangellaceae bacterium]|nr:biotin--[acetyl-CoA-carboxylase] ligase [Wenzhouxiangellaceae bacterium]